MIESFIVGVALTVLYELYETQIRRYDTVGKDKLLGIFMYSSVRLLLDVQYSDI
jgi:hypothetical protein